MASSPRILLVAGARPNFMKIAPIIRAMKAHGGFAWRLVHTGQHYDYEMSEAFFKDLEIPEPDHFLNVGSGSHAEQTAATMVAFERVCQEEQPDAVIVFGDVNSTLACSIVAKKLGVAVAHVEAGLRSFDMSMPEEINRMVADSISDWFFVTEQSGVENLLREGRPQERIHFVGHVMVDNLLCQRRKLERLPDAAFQYAGLKAELGTYLFMTLHRPANVDDRQVLGGIVEAVNTVAERVPIVFPVHPRTRKMLDQFGLSFSENVHCLPPLGFHDALYLWKDAMIVMTDSGGLQEETTALGVPCLTLRHNTERPITCEMGTNRLVGNDPARIVQAVARILDGDRPPHRVPPKWDGQAAARIVRILAGELKEKDASYTLEASVE